MTSYKADLHVTVDNSKIVERDDLITILLSNSEQQQIISKKVSGSLKYCFSELSLFMRDIEKQYNIVRSKIELDSRPSDIVVEYVEVHFKCKHLDTFNNIKNDIPDIHYSYNIKHIEDILVTTRITLGEIPTLQEPLFKYKSDIFSVKYEYVVIDTCMELDNNWINS